MNKKKELKRLYTEFYDLNRSYWDLPDLDTHDNILVYLPRYFVLPTINLLLFAKRLQEMAPCNIKVGYFRKIEWGKKKICRSFGVSEFIHVIKPTVYAILKTLSYLPRCLACQDGDSLLKLTVDASSDTIPVGEEIYDWIIRASKNLTLKHLPVGTRLRKPILYVYCFFSFYALLKQEKVSTFLFADCDYFGSAFTKACQVQKVRMFQVYQGYAIRHSESSNYKTLKAGQMTYQIFKKFTSLGNYRQIVEKEIQRQFTGTREGYMDAVAFRNKKLYRKDELLRLYGLKDDRKCVLVASHALSDTPHYSYNMIFRDYYDWLVNTIRILSAADKYHVFVKEHPSSWFYGETGSIASILKELGVENVYRIPDDLSTRCLFDIMDYFVTCCGTIGIEAACFGIPVVTAAKGYYYGYGLDYNCSDYESYKSCLENLEQLRKRPEITERAKIILSIFSHHDHGWNEFRSRLIPDRTGFSYLDYLNDDYRILKIMNGNLRANNPKDEYYESLLDNIFVFDNGCCPDRLSNSVDTPLQNILQGTE